MNKFNLRTGHVVTLRNGETYMVFRNCMYHNGKDVLVNKHNSWFRLSDFKDDLTFDDNTAYSNYTRDWDIMKVETTLHPYALVEDYGKGKVIWERQEAKRMTVSEIEKILGFKIEVVSEK